MTLPVFYMPQMNVTIKQSSPSACQPRAIIQSWVNLNIPMTVHACKPVTLELLRYAHDPAYVDGILAGCRQNGWGTQDTDVAISMRYTSGAMLDAAKEAMANRYVAVAPCSGFHHAKYAESSRECTFNGLVMTALELSARGLAKRIGILDLDMDYGDGTEALIHEHQADNMIRHLSTGGRYTHPDQADDFLNQIKTWVLAFQDCDVLLYQASANSHVDDPQGGYLTTEQLGQRDSEVFIWARTLGLPVAWIPASGYQREDTDGINQALRVHDNTFTRCWELYQDVLNRSSIPINLRIES